MNSTQNVNMVNNAPIVTGIDIIASKLFKPSLIIVFYFAPILIGFYKTNYLLDSPLLRIASNILGPCASALSGSIAYIIAFIIPHKYTFAKNVFNLSVYDHFRVSITLVFLLLPFTGVLARAFNRTFTTYLYRKFIFITTIIITLPILYFINLFLNTLPDKSAYIFSLSVLGIIFYAVFACISKDYRTQNPIIRNI